MLLRGPNNPWLAACWFGLKAGGVVVATMPLLRAGKLATIHEIASLDVALVDHRFVDAAAGLGLPTIAYGGEAPDDLTQRVTSKPTTFDDVATSCDDVALLAFTSGTTGRPKATMHLHRDVLAVCDTFSRHVLRPTPDECSPVRRRSRSRSGSAPCCSSRCTPAPRRFWSRRRRRPSWRP